MADPQTNTTATTTPPTTRLTYAHNLLTHPLPPRSSPAHAHLHAALCTLLAALTTHPAMAPNLSQPHDNPRPTSRTKVYFMWDFIARTLEHLHQFELGGREMGEGENAAPAGMGAEKEKQGWEDIRGRVAYARWLIFDDISANREGRAGALDMMMGDGAGSVGFGKEVERAARGL